MTRTTEQKRRDRIALDSYRAHRTRWRLFSQGVLNLTTVATVERDAKMARRQREMQEAAR